MRKSVFLLAALAAVSCGGGPVVSGPVDLQETYSVGAVTFRMAEVPGGTFMMGAQPDLRFIKGADKQHQVVLDGYGISAEPVSQALWTAVMGKNPSSTQGETLPVDRVSYKDAVKFVQKLAQKTGVPFVLPTEAMWEFAVLQGVFTPAKGTREWCSDFFAPAPATELTRNPQGPDEGNQQVVRTAVEREGLADFTKGGGLTFRLAVVTGKACPEAIVKAIVDKNPDREQVCANEVISVGGVKFNMVAVAGGTFLMGASEEQADYGDDNEKPVHEVTVEGFEIGQTEVTAALWKAVMGSLPIGNREKDLDRAVVNVSWYGAQMFLLKLNQMTGRKFRLPTEEEWEYAARGGKASRGYRFSGSSDIESVCVYTKKGAKKPLDVTRPKTRRPNELGIYDMSGNAWEWCQDPFRFYGKEPEAGEWMVIRGGSASSPWDACRVSNRSKIPASNIKGTFGLRLAL